MQLHPLARTRSTVSTSISLSLSHSGSAERELLEAGIARRFAERHCAKLNNFMPALLSLNIDGDLGAVVGLRPAAGRSLFLENYFDTPIEQAVSRAHRTPVDREEVVEIGNLAAITPGASYALFAVLARVISLAGFRWVACTATPQVSAMLDRMQFPSEMVCAAEKSRLGCGADDWGRYYEKRPCVITGDIRAANESLQANKAMSAITQSLENEIVKTAVSLTQSRIR